MDVNDFWYVYVKGINKETENRIYQQWLALLPNGFKDSALYTFRNYFDLVTGKNIDNRPADVIMAEIDEAMRRLNDNGN